MITTYQPSGKFGAQTLLFVLLATGWMCAGMYVYQLLLYWIPFIYINFLLTIGAGFVGAYAVTKAVRIGKCRNPMLAAGLGLLAAIVALGAKHYFQYDSLIAETAEVLVLEWQQENGEEIPAAGQNALEDELRRELPFFQHFQARAEQGWSIGRDAGDGTEVSGIMVYLVWLIEAGIIIYFAVTGPYEEAGKPFSEDLQLWADEEEDIGVLAVDGDSFTSKLAGAQTVDDLLTLPDAEPENTETFVGYKTHSIAGEDTEDAYLSISRIGLTVNKKGEAQRKETSIWKFAVLPAEQRATLLERFEEVARRRQAQAAMEQSVATDEDGTEESGE